MASSWLVERGGAVAGPLDRLHLGDKGVGGVDLAEQDLAAPENDGQQVVEVMGHAARQPGHGTQPLGLLELLEHALSLGDVLGHGQDPCHRTVVVQQRSGRHRQLEELVVSQGRQLHADGRFAVPCAVPQTRQGRGGHLVGRHDAQRRVGHGIEGGIVPTQQRARRAVPPSGRTRQVQLGDGQRRGLHHGLEPLLVALDGLIQPGVVEGDRRHLGQQDEDRFVLGVERPFATEHHDGPVPGPGGVDEGDGHPRHGPGSRRGQLGGDGGIGHLVEPTGIAQRSVGLAHESRRSVDDGRQAVGQDGGGAHLDLGVEYPVGRGDGVEGKFPGGKGENDSLLGVEDPAAVLGQHPEHLGLGQRRVHGQGCFHEPAQLGGVTSSGLLGLAALTPQQDTLDGDGHPLGQTARRLEVRTPVAAPPCPGDKAEGPERQAAEVHGHHQHRLDPRVRHRLAVAAGRGGLTPVGRSVALGVNHDLGPTSGQDAPHEGFSVGMGVAGVGCVPSAVGSVSDATQCALLVDDIDGEPVGEGRDHDVDEPHHGFVVGLEGGGEHVTGPGQDGHVLAGVLGAETAPAFSFVEPGPLDRGRRSVGHQLQELEVSLLETVPNARAHLDHPDDLTPHQERGRHEGRHPLAQERGRLGGLGHVVDDDGLGPRRHLADHPFAHPDLEALGHPGVEAVRGPHGEPRAFGGDQEDGGDVPTHDPARPGQELVEQLVEGKEGQARVGDRLDGPQGHPGVMQPEADAPLGHTPEHQDDDDHDRAGKDEQPCQGAVDGEEVEDDEGEQGPGHDQGGLAQEGVAPEGLVKKPVRFGPVVVRDDGGGISRLRVPTGGADFSLTSSGQPGQAPHAP